MSSIASFKVSEHTKTKLPQKSVSEVRLIANWCGYSAGGWAADLKHLAEQCAASPQKGRSPSIVRSEVSVVIGEDRAVCG